jgi:hypothetical protein
MLENSGRNLFEPYFTVTNDESVWTGKKAPEDFPSRIAAFTERFTMRPQFPTNSSWL